MRQLVIVIAFLSLLVADETVGQDRPVSKPYVVSLSRDCDPASVSLEYFITGSFGGYGSFVGTNAKVFDYEIPTSHEGTPAITLKLIIKGPKYKTLSFDFPSVNEAGIRIQANLQRQSQLEFKGKIMSTESITDGWMQLEVIYWARWKCDYLGLADCMLGPERIALVDINAEGGFKALLPDFGNDPALVAFADKGSFGFTIRDRKTGNTVYNLRPENSPKGRNEISVASRYPATQVFFAERPDYRPVR